jgi:hypothetical protein
MDRIAFATVGLNSGGAVSYYACIRQIDAAGLSSDNFDKNCEIGDNAIFLFLLS